MAMLGTFKREKEPVHESSCKDDLKRDGHDLDGVGASAVLGSVCLRRLF